jgi:ABC-type nitrate/sulfonate/bicarbonate transport system ATPase subunit
LIRLEQLGMTYTRRDGSPLQALASVDVTLAREGEFISLLGPSGCGKTTLLKLVAGLLTPTHGSVIINERPVTGPGPDRAVGFQDFVLLPWDTVLSNAAFALEMRGMDRKAREGVAREKLGLVGLSNFENSYPHELSGGMKQRVGLARALAADPEILLMDEPFGSLDALTRQVLQEELLKIWESDQKTVIFVTHSIEEAVFLSDRVVVMGTRPGRVLRDVQIDLPRPRPEAVRTEPRFRELSEDLWQELRGQIELSGEAAGAPA